MGNPDWAMKAEFATPSRRKENEDQLERLIADWTINHTPEQAEAILQDGGVAASIVSKPSEIYEDPRVKHRQ